MPWPTPLEYQEALAFPQRCFTDPALKAAQVTSQTLFGLPQPITGNFATIYRLNNADGAWAVRLFLRDDPLRLERYTHLAALPGLPECFLPFDFQPEGIALASGRFPLLKMPWQAGAPLNVWVEQNLNDSAALKALAGQWAERVRELEVAQLAHGDLQHGNILVAPSGELRLLDYDGVWSASLASLTPGELGHPSYQRPGRLYSSTMDRFPALVIYTALRVLAQAPELWYRLDNGDNLLFRREDFADPSNSRTFALLREVRGLRPLVTALQDACTCPLDFVPPVSRFV